MTIQVNPGISTVARQNQQDSRSLSGPQLESPHDPHDPIQRFLATHDGLGLRPLSSGANRAGSASSLVAFTPKEAVGSVVWVESSAIGCRENVLRDSSEGVCYPITRVIR